jgi:hypothetical protein
MAARGLGPEIVDIVVGHLLTELSQRQQDRLDDR